MSPICGVKVCESQIRPVLSVLIEDRDRDVRYFASRAMEALDTFVQSGEANEN